MESKLNALALETYSLAFTDRVANNFFARHEKINGEQILTLSPVQQVNLFVIKNLFDAWQHEAANLRSPFFNYNHPKVQEAQKMYMNTLSRHISIAEVDMKPLFQKAVQDTLHLLFSPITFLRKALKPTSGKPEKIIEVLRYIKINQAYAKEAKGILNRQEVTDENWIGNLQNALLDLEKENKLKPDAPATYLQQFSQVLPLTPSEILRDEEMLMDEDAETDFFSSITGSLEEEEENKAPAPDLQPTQARNYEEEEIKPAAEPAHRHAVFKREEPDLSLKTPDIRITEPKGNEENQQKTLNDRLRLKTDQKPLNHSWASTPSEKPSIAASHARKKASNIRSTITLNQRFMFTNELFNGDTQAFNQALDQLDGFHSYVEAYQYTMRHYARQYDWEEDSEASQEFLQILQSRYGEN